MTIPLLSEGRLGVWWHSATDGGSEALATIAGLRTFYDQQQTPIPLVIQLHDRLAACEGEPGAEERLEIWALLSQLYNSFALPK